MAFTTDTKHTLVAAYLESSKPEDITLVIRQGETVRLPVAVIKREIDILSILPIDENQVEVKTRTSHCLKECDRVILNGVQCRDACNDPNGCHMAMSITDDTTFVIDNLTISGDPTATCRQCSGGKVMIPVDLTGTQISAQVRQGHSAERYAPPIVNARINQDTSVLAIADCEGCPGIAKGDYIDVPEAGIHAALVIRLERTASRQSKQYRGCSTPASGSCKAILDQVAAQDACSTKVTLHSEPFATFTSKVDEPRDGVIELILPSSESQQIPIPWCENITLPKPDGRAGYGPHRWDVKLRTQDGDYWLAEGAVIMLPSTTM